MKNVNLKTEEKTLKIEVDLSRDFGASKSGKTIIATTEEYITIPGSDAKLGLIVYK